MNTCSVQECACSAAGILPVSVTSLKPLTEQATSAQLISWKRVTSKLMNPVQVREAKKEAEGQEGKLQTEDGQGLAIGKVVEVVVRDLLVTYMT